jgi:hypothetical protein
MRTIEKINGASGSPQHRFHGRRPRGSSSKHFASIQTDRRSAYINQRRTVTKTVIPGDAVRKFISGTWSRFATTCRKAVLEAVNSGARPITENEQFG